MVERSAMFVPNRPSGGCKGEDKRGERTTATPNPMSALQQAAAPVFQLIHKAGVLSRSKSRSKC